MVSIDGAFRQGVPWLGVGGRSDSLCTGVEAGALKRGYIRKSVLSTLVHFHTWHRVVVHIVVTLAIVVRRPYEFWLGFVGIDMNHPAK